MTKIIKIESCNTCVFKTVGEVNKMNECSRSFKHLVLGNDLGKKFIHPDCPLEDYVTPKTDS